jgi:hypothetical protein
LTLTAAIDFLTHIIITKEAAYNSNMEMPDLLESLVRKARQLSEHALAAQGKIVKYSS